MNKLIKYIISIFTDDTLLEPSSSKEDLDVCEVYYTIENYKVTLPNNPNFVDLNNRDHLELGFFALTDSDEELFVYQVDNNEGWSDFKESYGNNKQSFKLKIRITKNEIDSRISIYEENIFYNWLSKLDILDILEIFDSYLSKGYLILEVQKNYPTIATSRISLVGKGSALELSGNITENVYEKARSICFNDLIMDFLLPDDLYVKDDSLKENKFVQLFDRIAIAYFIIFLYDNTRIDTGVLYYKLDGFRTISGNINLDEFLTNEDLNLRETLKKYYDIYCWLYNGGNIVDKALILRNILSLNIIPNSYLLVNEDIIDAIKSNYRIYEKENVKQYIALRNNISDLLLDLQKDIINVIDEFENGIKRLWFAFFTFVLSTVLIRVLGANVNNSILIPDVVIFILAVLCIIFCVYYKFSRKEVDRKESLLFDHFDIALSLYKNLLCDEEINSLVKNKRKSCKEFCVSKKNMIQQIFIVVVIAVFSILFIMLSVNNINIIYSLWK